jgi:hypothetical protein
VKPGFGVTMQQRRIGPFSVSALGLGCMNLSMDAFISGNRYSNTTRQEIDTEFFKSNRPAFILHLISEPKT